MFQATLWEGSFSHPVGLSGRSFRPHTGLSLQPQCAVVGAGALSFLSWKMGVSWGLESTEKIKRINCLSDWGVRSASWLADGGAGNRRLLCPDGQGWQRPGGARSDPQGRSAQVWQSQEPGEVLLPGASSCRLTPSARPLWPGAESAGTSRFLGWTASHSRELLSPALVLTPRFPSSALFRARN